MLSREVTIHIFFPSLLFLIVSLPPSLPPSPPLPPRQGIKMFQKEGGWANLWTVVGGGGGEEGAALLGKEGGREGGREGGWTLAGGGAEEEGFLFGK